jgi:hypothetical protein
MGPIMAHATEEEKIAARKERKKAREAIYRARNRQDPERVASAKAYQAAWYAQRRKDPNWVADKAAKLEQKRQDPEWVAKRKAHDKAYYEEQKAKGINYYESLKANPEKKAKKKAWEVEWKKNNPERWKEIQQRSEEKKWQTDPVKFLLRHLKSIAKKKGIEFNLEPDDFTIPEVCPVLGIPITPDAWGLAPGLPSFDRIDPPKGYVKGNVKIISLRANRLKSDCTDPAELRAVADYIERYMNSTTGGYDG